jgi:hypothetical protein
MEAENKPRQAVHINWYKFGRFRVMVKVVYCPVSATARRTKTGARGVNAIYATNLRPATCTVRHIISDTIFYTSPMMEQNQIHAIEKRLYEDRGKAFRGTAKVRFEALSFNQPNRELRIKIIDHLKEKFQREGCIRLEAKNYIPAVISQASLDAAMRASNITQSLLVENRGSDLVQLNFPRNVTVECLQGLHRIAAAKLMLPQSDWWWVIDIYVDGIVIRFSVPV